MNWCWLIGHNYEEWQRFTSHSRRVVCLKCGGDWGMHDEVGGGSLLPWNDELADVYRVMGMTIHPGPKS